MKKLLSLILFLAMLLSLVSCGGTDLEIDDGKIVASWKVPEAFNRLEEAFPDYKVRGYELNPIDNFEFEAYYYICTLPTSERVYIYKFATEEQAQKHASNYYADASGYSWTDIFGNGQSMVIDYELPVHFWLCEDCVVEYGGNDEIAVKLTELFGEQFAGDGLVIEIQAEEKKDETVINDPDISYTVEYARVSIGETELRPAEPISTREELENYCQALKNSYYWSPYCEPYTEKFEELMKNYPAEWFENNSLIIVRTYSGSIPVEYTVENVRFTDGKYTVTVSSEAGCDEAIEEGCLLIGLDGVKLSAESEIEIAADFSLILDTVEHDGEQLTLEKLIELDESGNKLGWSDFEQYESDDSGSGLYILRYFLRDRGYLMLIGGGSLEEDPDYIRLIRVYQDREESCEVGFGNIREFVERIGTVE